MSEFMKQELNRLVQKIPVTDPCSSEYHVLLRSIEYLDSMGATIEEILAQVFEEPGDGAGESSAIKARPGKAELVPFPGKKEPVPQPEPAEPVPEPTPITDPVEPPVETEPTYSAAQVRKALVDARSKGVDIKAVLAKVGADNFQGVPAAKYGTIMKELEVVE